MLDVFLHQNSVQFRIVRSSTSVIKKHYYYCKPDREAPMALQRKSICTHVIFAHNIFRKYLYTICTKYIMYTVIKPQMRLKVNDSQIIQSNCLLNLSNVDINIIICAYLI